MLWHRHLFVLCLTAIFLALASWITPAVATTIRGAAERKVARQKEQNKKWKKAAEAREAELYEKADQYYRVKLYRKAARYYKKVLDLRYSQWDFEEVGDAEFRTILPARRKKRYKLGSKKGRIARARLESLGERVEAEKKKLAKKQIDSLTEKAEVAMMLGNPAKAYRIYGDLIELTTEMGESRQAVSSKLNALKKRKAIVANAAKPIQNAAKLIKAGKTAEAKRILATFKEDYQAMMDTIPDLAKRYERLLATPELLEENREQEVQKRILAGDAALLREDYISAEKHYRTAATMHPGTEAGKQAVLKLTNLLNDPKITAAMKQQRAERECKPLLARARYLLRFDDPKGAGKVCRQVIERHPGTKWAKQAQEILDSMK